MTQKLATVHSEVPYRVLCIDGGGMRGIYTAAYLDELVKRYASHRNLAGIGLDIGKAFDLIVGTSTGAIIAAGIAAAVPPSEILKLYRKEGPNIFPSKIPSGVNWTLLKQLWTRPRLLATGEKALADALEKVFGTITIGELYKKRGIGLAIPAVEMARHHAWIFKTSHLPNSIGRDDDYQISDVCRATSAAPLYRSLAALDNPNGEGYRVFADGGLYANTPVMVGLIDALQMTEPNQHIQIFGLGNCKRPAGQAIKKSAVHRGLGDWKFGGEAASLAIDAQEEVAWEMARLLARHVERRLDLIQFPRGAVSASAMAFLDLDETSIEAADVMVAQAQADVIGTLTACADEENATGRALKQLLMDIPPYTVDKRSTQEEH